jgi:hypothetical protein
MISPDGYGGFRKTKFGDDFPNPIPIMPMTSGREVMIKLTRPLLWIVFIVITMHEASLYGLYTY